MPKSRSDRQATGRPRARVHPSGRRRSAWLQGLLVWLVLIGAAGLLLVAPHALSLYWVRILSNIFMFAIIAQGINIIAGYTGYPAFGNVVFFGLGAYSTAIFMIRYQGSFFAGLLVGILVCGLCALIFGPPLLRLRGHYFAIATLGLNEAIKAINTNLTDFTGGGMGLSLPLPAGGPVESARLFYYLLFATMALGLATTYWFAGSRLGYTCQAIRDDEVKAEAMGLRTTWGKTLAWLIGAVLTGIAGSIYAYGFSYGGPPAVFDMTIAVKSFVIFLLGGAGTLFGPIIGAIFIELVATLTWSHFLNYHVGILGMIVILIVLFMPMGAVGFLRDRLATAVSLFDTRR